MRNILPKGSSIDIDKSIQLLIDTYSALNDVRIYENLVISNQKLLLKQNGTKHLSKDIVFEKYGLKEHIEGRELSKTEQKNLKFTSEQIETIENVIPLLNSFDFFTLKNDFNNDELKSFHIPFEEIKNCLTVELTGLFELLKRDFNRRKELSALDVNTFIKRELKKYKNAEIKYLDDLVGGYFISNLHDRDKRDRLIVELAGIKFIQYLNQLESEIKSVEFLDFEQTMRAIEKEKKEFERKKSELDLEKTEIQTQRNKLKSEQDEYEKNYKAYKKLQSKFPDIMQWQSQTNYFGTFFGELIKGDVIDTSQANAIKFLSLLFKDRSGEQFKSAYAKNALAQKEKSKSSAGDYYDLLVMLLTKMLVSIFKSKFSPEYIKLLKSKTDNRNKPYVELSEITNYERQLLLEQLDKMLKEYKMGSIIPYPVEDKEKFLSAIEKLVDKNKLGIIVPYPKPDAKQFYEKVQDIIKENKLERTLTLK